MHVIQKEEPNHKLPHYIGAVPAAAASPMSEEDQHMRMVLLLDANLSDSRSNADVPFASIEASTLEAGPRQQYTSAVRTPLVPVEY